MEIRELQYCTARFISSKSLQGLLFISTFTSKAISPSTCGILMSKRLSSLSAAYLLLNNSVSIAFAMEPPPRIDTMLSRSYPCSSGMNSFTILDRAEVWRTISFATRSLDVSKPYTSVISSILSPGA